MSEVSGASWVSALSAGSVVSCAVCVSELSRVSREESEASVEVLDVSKSLMMIQEQVLRSHVKLGGHWGSAQASCVLD